MTDLAILIPARNEMFLKRTIADILEHSEADTEVIAVLDGAWAEPPIPDDERVTILYHPVSVGQRAATNNAAKLARLRGIPWVMKCDAHCSFGQGFDRILLEDIEPDVTIVPAMKNLHAFDWVCANGHRRYQGPSGPCKECGEPTEMDVVWYAKPNPYTTSMRFDPDLKFQYWGGYKEKQSGDVVETMSLLGACWMLSTERYFALNICDEQHGSWGQQGTEVACKTWLSGGRLLCDKRTWFAHMFRTQGGDFGFPYPLSGSAVNRARDYSRALFLDGEWEGAKYPLSWLLEKFWPVQGWTEEDLAALKPNDRPTERQPKTNETPTKAIVYYTDNRLDEQIMTACQQQLLKAGLPIYSVSLRPLYFGHNITINAERGPLTMFRQILAGLEACEADVVFLAEHDVLYHPSHFKFTPERDDLFYYDNNLWRVDAESGRALFHYSNHTSQLCARRSLLLEHYRERVRRVEAEGFSRRMGYEPGTHRRAERVDDYGCAIWMSETPSIDLRHRYNLTQTRWSKDQFRDQRYTRGWTEAGSVPGWGRTAGRMQEILNNGTK